ncbi:MAG: T9SS type A sorting domain-containing protein [Bacteroidota bacterium]|mgnify:FL=1
MKKLYTLAFCLFFGFALAAQNDTLLFQNFQALENPTSDWALFPIGDDTTWVKYDEDQLPGNGSDPVQQNWYWDFIYHYEFYPDTSISTANMAMISLSWMADIASVNRNWIVTPPISIYDDQAVLSWKSAPYQLPRYIDGYKVLVSTGTNDLDSFTDTLFVASEMTAILGAGGQTLELDSFSFSPGYFHADGMMDSSYFTILSNTLAGGLLEPHSVSLAQYAGQQIYVAFLHDAFDDNLLALDDILVTGSATSDAITIEADGFRFYTYPNPAERQLNVLYRLPEATQVSLQMTDTQGKVVKTCLANERQDAGEQQFQILVNDLPKGNYFITLTIHGNHFTKSFFKR